MSDPKNTQGTPGANDDADTASGGAPDDADQSTDESTRKILDDETTDEDGKPLENPSGG